ncbi:MAG: hypothetical protein ABEN55_11540 [Bradymonadaceae bacterium]
MDEIERGDRVAVAKCGPLEVVRIEEDGTVILDDRGEELALPPEEAARRIRPLVDREEAAAIRENFEQMGEPVVSERPYQRNKTYREVLQGNDLREMARTLCGLYRHPSPDYPEEQNVDRFEEAVVGEMAEVLEVEASALMREARQVCGEPFPVPDRSEAVAEAEPLPELQGYDAIGAFATEEAVVAGEAGQGIDLEVEPGVWLAYEYHDEEVEAPDKLLCVRTEVFEDLAVYGEQLTRTGAFPIEAASAAVVDAQLLDEASFKSALAFSGGGIVDGRGVQVLREEDGRGVVYSATGDEAVVLVVVNLY